jgi:hypothetical protein
LAFLYLSILKLKTYNYLFISFYITSKEALKIKFFEKNNYYCDFQII